jgi:hypothetical protein
MNENGINKNQEAHEANHFPPKRCLMEIRGFLM